MPAARFQGFRIADLDLVSATLLFDVEVSNPYPVPLPLLDLAYRLESRGASFLSGKADAGGTIPAQGSRVLQIPARVAFSEVLAALKDVKPGAVVPWSAFFDVSLEVPAAGTLRLPLRKEGEFPIPAPPTVAVDGVRVEDLSLSGAEVIFDVSVGNRNEFPVDIAKMSYEIGLGGLEVTRGALERAVALSAGGESALPLKTSLSFGKLGLAVFDIVRGKEAAYRIAGDLRLKTRFGALSFPYLREGQVGVHRIVEGAR